METNNTITSDQAREIEVSIEDAKKIVQRMEALARLEKNRDFKKIFLDGYFKEEPARLAGLSGSPELLESDNISMDELWSMTRAIGHLRNYLINVHRMGRAMEAQMKQAQEFLDSAEIEE